MHGNTLEHLSSCSHSSSFFHLIALFVIWTVFNPKSSSPNKVWFGSEEIGSPKGFLAYSETGRKRVSLHLPLQETLDILFLFFCLLCHSAMSCSCPMTCILNYFLKQLYSQGRVVYANYGELADLQTVKNEYNVNLNGSVVLMRAGKISMAQKVTH